MFRLLVICAIILASSAHASPRRTSAEIPPDEKGGGGMPTIAAAWQGGTGSLPYNNGTSPQALLQYAQDLVGTPHAMQALASRGLVRQQNEDVAVTSLGQSTIYFCYELPGVPVAVQRLVLIVRSQAVQYADGLWYPVTVIASSVVRDTVINDRHIPVVVRGAGHEMLLYAEFPPGTTEGIDDVFRITYSMQEFKNNTLDWTRAQFFPEFTDAQCQWTYGLADEIAAGAMSGGAVGGTYGAWSGGPAGAVSGFGAGLATGAVGGAVYWVARNPYPPRGQ